MSVEKVEFILKSILALLDEIYKLLYGSGHPGFPRGLQSKL